MVKEKLVSIGLSTKHLLISTAEISQLAWFTKQAKLVLGIFIRQRGGFTNSMGVVLYVLLFSE